MARRRSEFAATLRPAPSSGALHILATGGLTTVQDGGRIGWAHLGVSRSGAADLVALRLANRLAGNDADAAALEITGGGLEFETDRPLTVALTGAICPGLDSHVAVSLPRGARIRLGHPISGLRSYLAVRGGLEVAAQLGSCSTDTLSGLGPAPVHPGATIPVGHGGVADVNGAYAAPAAAPEALGIVAGPRNDWFTDDALSRITAARWEISVDSDRVGTRLLGPELARRDTNELPSEPTLPGALQVPPDGRPIILGPDAPVTGGYPVIAVVTSADLHHCGQLRPGSAVSFRLCR